MAAALVTGGSSAELERLVRAYARDLRRAGVPPEQALTRVKDVVGLTAVTPLHARAMSSDGLASLVVSWFVAAYYRAD